MSRYEDEPVRDGAFFPNARLSRLGLDAYARQWGVKDWTEFMTTFGVTPETRAQHTMVVSILASWLPELEARNEEIARLRAREEELYRIFYTACGAMDIRPGGTRYADGVLAARAILLGAMNSAGWEVFFHPDPVRSEPAPGSRDWCEACQADIGDEPNHYHCAQCGRRTSMYGHQRGCPPKLVTTTMRRDPSQDVVSLVDDDEEDDGEGC